MNSRRGFTLIELLIAVLLSAGVLLGILSVATSMLRYHFDSKRKGAVSGHSVFSLARMNKELENASYLAQPSAAAGQQNYMAGCTNWTTTTPGGVRIDAQLDPDGPGPLTQATNVATFHYCVTPANCGGAGPPPYFNPCTLYRYGRDSNTCFAATFSPAPCGQDFPPYSKEVVVNASFYHLDGNGGIAFFRRADEVSGVETRYMVGVATATGQTTAPQYMRITSRIAMNKSFNNTDD